MTLALRAPGALRELNERGVLDAADVHVAQRLASLVGETDERCLLALALAVRGVRQGSVVLDLAEVPEQVRPEEGEALSWPSLEDWRAALSASALVGTALHREDDLLWLDGYWRQEVFVAEELLGRAAVAPLVDSSRLGVALARLWPGSEPDDQRLAAAVCALSSVAVLCGGPGTGKTTTVARLLVALQESSPGPLRIALAAPTGKAAARLREAMIRPDPDDRLSTSEKEALATLPSSTLHRLLGVRRGSDRFWHDASNRLPYDVVVVDEASMVSLSMFAKLLEALRPGTRLILVGDPHQLVSVEAGAVLADLVGDDEDAGRTSERLAALASVVPADGPGVQVPASPGARLRDGVVGLTRTRRFEGEGPIDLLAQAIKGERPDEVLSLLRAGGPLELVEKEDDQPVPASVLRPVLLEVATAVIEAAAAGDAVGALQALDRHRLLCAHRRDVRHWEQEVQSWLLRDGLISPRRDGRYAGQPLLVTSNDYDNRLWNGDTGVVVAEDGVLVAYFSTGGEPARVPLGRLGDVRPMHAMTVHRSQGSQFKSVTVLLPPATSPLGTRETLYTAVTRAEERVRVIGSAGGILTAVARRVHRASGLQSRLWPPEATGDEETGVATG
jgi:exodeoxyribonuclease V alpha subunit